MSAALLWAIAIGCEGLITEELIMAVRELKEREQISVDTEFVKVGGVLFVNAEKHEATVERIAEERDGLRRQLAAKKDEITTLRDWKESAIYLLGEWDKVWEALGKPGRLGSSKAEESLKAAAAKEAEVSDLTARLAPYIRKRDFGFAPGSYLNHCRECGEQFVGDKRSVACGCCAEKLALKAECEAATERGQQAEAALQAARADGAVCVEAVRKLCQFIGWEGRRDWMKELPLSGDVERAVNAALSAPNPGAELLAQLESDCVNSACNECGLELFSAICNQCLLRGAGI